MSYALEGHDWQASGQAKYSESPNATSQPARGKSAAFLQADQWKATTSSVRVESNFSYLLA